MSAPSIKPTHKSIAAYYDALDKFKAFKAAHEGTTETAIHRLAATRRLCGEERFGEDTSDDLDDEIQKKIKSKYPLTNIIFEDTREAVLFQSRTEHARFDLTKAQEVADRFVGWVEALRNPPVRKWWVPQSLHPPYKTGVHAPQRDRFRSGKGDRRAGEQELQPGRVPQVL